MYKNDEYPYLYETHLHTNVGSACGNDSPEDMVRACKEFGYTGLFVTEHDWGGNTAIDRSLPWKDFVDAYMEGYYRAKAEGDKLGVQVFFGMERGYNATEFLIYGLTKEWLYAHPEFWDTTIESQYELVKSAGGLVSHAHPFREEPYIPEIRLFPDFVDAVEGINATHSSKKSQYHNNPIWNDLAMEYAAKHNKPLTGGSDVHSTDLFYGGMAFKRKLNDVQDFIAEVKKGTDYIILTGNEGYEKM